MNEKYHIFKTTFISQDPPKEETFYSVYQFRFGPPNRRIFSEHAKEIPTIAYQTMLDLANRIKEGWAMLEKWENLIEYSRPSNTMRWNKSEGLTSDLLALEKAAANESFAYYAQRLLPRKVAPKKEPPKTKIEERELARRKMGLYGTEDPGKRRRL